MIKVEFEIKGGIKEVSVDFYSHDWTFLNHLKRRVNQQIKEGATKKNHLFSLINKGLFTVKEDDTILYSKLTIDKEVSSDFIIYTRLPDDLNIEEICIELDVLETRTINLHQRLQFLFNIEETLIVDKMKS